MAGTLFITLRIFSATGGIEKVCRIMGKALAEISAANKTDLEIVSLYDAQNAADNNPYFSPGIFKGFAQSKIAAAFYAASKGRKKEKIVLSHVNLLPIGWLIKKISPSIQLILLAHGIEVWKPLSSFKKKMLQQADMVLAVSEYTRQQLIKVQGVDPAKSIVLNNCLDPFLLPATSGNSDLRKKYHIADDAIVLFCLTRLAATERHKGYDKVIRSVGYLQQQLNKRVVYVIAGKCTADEAVFIQSVAATAGVPDDIILTGYVADDEIPAHFTMADVYVMPSSKEGFGIVFIEAMYYGLPVIAGNKDGSADALLQGKLGLLVDPGDENSVRNVLLAVLHKRSSYLPDGEMLQQHFGFDTYKNKLRKILVASVN